VGSRRSSLPASIELDDSRDYGEDHLILFGRAADGKILIVVYTKREDRIRIISARGATKHEQDDCTRANSP